MINNDQPVEKKTRKLERVKMKSNKSIDEGHYYKSHRAKMKIQFKKLNK